MSKAAAVRQVVSSRWSELVATYKEDEILYLCRIYCTGYTEPMVIATARVDWNGKIIECDNPHLRKSITKRIS